MTTIDLDVLDTVKGGAASVAATTGLGLGHGAFHLLHKLGNEVNNLATSNQSSSSDQTMLLAAAMFASRR